jgi:hypothetical protein
MEVTVVPKNVNPKPGQTRSAATLQRIVRRHGAEHARLTMQILTESDNCKAYLSETVIGAVSDLLLLFEREYPDIFHKETSRIFAFFDQTPIGQLEYLYVRNLDGITNRRSAFVGILHERVVRIFGSSQMDLLDDRRRQ